MVPCPTPATVRRIAGMAAVAGVLAASAGAAQRVDGRLLESGTDRPIVLGTVALLDTAMTVVDETFTNEQGEFSLRSERAGHFYLLAQRLGYSRKVDGILELGDGGLITVDFYLRASPVALDSLSVETWRRQTIDYLREVGYWNRLESGSAWFLTPETLDRSKPPNVATLLRPAPGAMLLEHSAGQTLLFRSNSIHPGREGIDPAGFCTPRVLVDGTEVRTHWNFPQTAVAGAMIDDAVDVDDIVAVEVHNGPATLPLVYGGSVDNGCATVLIWTFHARVLPGRSR